MNTKLYIPIGHGNEHIRELVTEIVTSVANRMQLSINHIDTIALAFKEQYQQAVSELFENGTFANNGDYEGVAKTKTDFNNDQPLHTMLFKDYVFELILAGRKTNLEVQDWDPELQMGYHIISHELGHCKDAEIRIIATHEQKFIFPNGFNLDLVHAYYYPILVDELFACFHADRFYNVEHFRYQATQDSEALSRSWGNVTSYSCNSEMENQIYQVAVSSSGFIWMYLIQYAKLWAGKLGTSFENEVILISVGNIFPNPEVEEKIDSVLRNLTQIYPIISGINDDFYNLWNFISMHAGYKFEKHNERWCCFWD